MDFPDGANIFESALVEIRSPCKYKQIQVQESTLVSEMYNY